MANETAKKLALNPGQFLDVVKALGIPVLEQSGFYQVQGPTGRRLYIAKGKICTRVDLSGFEADFGTKSPDQGVFGNVKQQMAWPEGSTGEDILRLFGSLCEHMMALPPVVKEKAPKKERAPKAAGPEVKTEDLLPQDEESKEARLARIRRVAEEMGAKVSERTEAELGAAQA